MVKLVNVMVMMDDAKLFKDIADYKALKIIH